MKIYNNITELIGKTPLVKINKLNVNGYSNIIAKLECFNPANSIKDRTALNMIEDAELKGKIKPGVSTLIEPTSGNTGIGLAFISAVKGYKLILTMPENMSNERKLMVKAYGAEIVLTDSEKGMQGAIDKAEEISKEINNSYILRQFDNSANTEIHEKTTALEIWEDTAGKVDVVVAGVGTGGTLTGIAKFLKEKNNNIQIVAVEPYTSSVLSGLPSGKHNLQGIGAGFIPKICDIKLFDKIFRVTDEQAILTSRKMALQEGILCGISSGAAMYAALEISKDKQYKDKLITVIIPDYGERYLSTELFKI